MRSEAVRHQVGSRPLLLLLLIGALTAGIFGMHGLVCSAGTSGAEHLRSMAAGTGMSNAAPGEGGMVGNQTATAAAASSPVSTQAMAAPVAEPAGTDMGDMLMLCVAVLTVAAGALLALLALLALRGLCRRVLGFLPPGRFDLRPVLARVRSGPPPVWRFSVIRC